MVINARPYADFKLLANTLRHLDYVCYNNSVTNANLNGGSTTSVAYAFDYQAGQCLSVETTNTFTFSLTDFPNAVALGDHLLVSTVSAGSSTF